MRRDRRSRYGFTSKPLSIKKLLIRRKGAPNGCDSRKFRLYLPENPTEAAEIRIARYIRRHLRQVRISIGKHRFGKNGRQHSNNLVRYPALTIFAEDRIRLGKLRASSRFLLGFHYLCRNRRQFGNLCKRQATGPKR